MRTNVKQFARYIYHIKLPESHKQNSPIDKQVSNATYIFESIFAELGEQLQEADGREPGTPEDDLIHELHIDDTENEDELVEDEVPKLVFHVLALRNSQLAEHHSLNRLAQDEEAAVGHVDQSLQNKWQVHQ